MKKPDYQNLPSLNSLKAFEAAARHLSFTRAAGELSVTQGAVSRQVKQLEEHLSVALFHRQHRRLTLTRQGRLLVQPLARAFDIMAHAVGRLRQGPQDLNLKVHPTFAIRWLIPRLHRFQASHPRYPGPPDHIPYQCGFFPGKLRCRHHPFRGRHARRDPGKDPQGAVNTGLCA